MDLAAQLVEPEPKLGLGVEARSGPPGRGPGDEGRVIPVRTTSRIAIVVISSKRVSALAAGGAARAQARLTTTSLRPPPAPCGRCPCCGLRCPRAPSVGGDQQAQRPGAVPPALPGAGDDPGVLVEPVLHVRVGRLRVPASHAEVARAGGQRELVERLGLRAGERERGLRPRFAAASPSRRASFAAFASRLRFAAGFAVVAGSARRRVRLRRLPSASGAPCPGTATRSPARPPADSCPWRAGP